MNAAQLLKEAKKLGEIQTIFRFPYVHIIYLSPKFQNIDDEEREISFAQDINISVAELRTTLLNSLLSLRLLTSEEFALEYPENRPRERGHHWLSSLIEQQFQKSVVNDQVSKELKIVHFYGYKGGQARSTLLGLMSTVLAEDGWKVLVIDSDIEAPSLDIIYGRTSGSISGTLLGVVQSVAEIKPERVKSIPLAGYVDLLACRPTSPDFNIDAAAFALRSALEPMIIENAARRISEFAAEKYDIILIDHRAGLSPVTLPWMTTLPGPIVVCVRLDDQWLPAKQFIESVLRTHISNPGVFVSWQPDNENEESYINRNNQQIETLLDMLAEIISQESEDEDSELSAVEVRDHWIIWPYDSAFRYSRLPDKNQLAPKNFDKLSSLRSILNIASKKQIQNNILTPSGATDEGDLIQTDALQQLLIPDNSISYIFGRKGTGKTRLLKELAKAEIGEPLLVTADNAEDKGLKSPSPELSAAIEHYRDTPENLWWNLLLAALETKTTSRELLRENFSQKLEENFNGNIINLIIDQLNQSPKRTFLLDGLETAFDAKLTFTYIESLFRFIQTIESDDRLSNRLQFKIFLRTDLAERGYQNIEQQIFGKVIYLNWDTQKIFNFILSRIRNINWYRQNFPDLIKRIEEKREDIQRGVLSTEECENLLLMAFPEKLRRNNLATKTFLKTYFADSASETPEGSTTDKLRYYPRIFDKFIQVIANPTSTDVGSFTGKQIEDGKIDPSLIVIAHEAAAKDYLGQLRSELNYLINLADHMSENEQKIRSLLSAFDGLKTPFKLDQCISELAEKTQIDKSKIRNAIESMKRVGMFEDRPKYTGELRVGRLFKSSLRMKYNRKYPHKDSGN
jgi:MinD-like ATPase involved in chromosome partitioning or flagellar assembly